MKYFVERGYDVHLISFAEITAERVGELTTLGIKYHGVTGNVHLKRFWLTLKDLKFVRSVLKKEKIDILHSHFLGPNVWYGALSGFHPHIVTAMGGDVTGKDWTPSRNAQERFLTPYALRNADVVTAWGPVLAERLRPYVRKGVNIEITHGGVDLKQFKPGSKSSFLRKSLNIPEDGRIVFSPRLIRRLYNIDTIARAAGLVCTQRLNVYFVIALPETILDDEYVTEIKQIFADSAAKDAVRFVPTIRYDEMADHYRLADASVSIPDTDGTPMTVLESMACGTPTVIGNLPDYDREYFEHEATTLMTDVKDPHSVANTILRFLSDGDLANRITDEARHRVTATGGYEYQMGKMDEIYRRVLKP